MKVRYTATALAEISEILAYIAQDSPAAARRMARRIRDTVERLRAFPESAARTDDPTIRVATVPGPLTSSSPWSRKTRSSSATCVMPRDKDPDRRAAYSAAMGIDGSPDRNRASRSASSVFAASRLRSLM